MVTRVDVTGLIIHFIVARLRAKGGSLYGFAMASVSETLFVVDVRDMARATAFYRAAVGATVVFASDQWTSLAVAGVRVALSLDVAASGGRTGLHFVVADVERARGDIARAGGVAGAPAVTVAPGVVIADVADSEGNGFTVSQRAGG